MDARMERQAGQDEQDARAGIFFYARGKMAASANSPIQRTYVSRNG